VKGNIHWVSAPHAYKTKYDSTTACSRDAPGSERDFLADINPHSKTVVHAYCEPS